MKEKLRQSDVNDSPRVTELHTQLLVSAQGSVGNNEDN